MRTGSFGIGDTDDWPAPPAQLRPRLVTPASSSYEEVRSAYTRAGAPAAVVEVQSEEDASSAVSWAAAVRRETGRHIPFSVRSRGHGFTGSSTNDGGIVVSLGGLRAITILDESAAGALVSVQAGASWGEVDSALAPHGLALSSGNSPETGVGGTATSGGIGFLARKQGLTLDRVRRVKVVTADGSVRWVDQSHEPDLFWALRGGATQAGIALEFEFDVPRLASAETGAVIAQDIQFLVADLPAFTAAWGDWVRTSPRDLGSFLTLQSTADGGFVAQAINVWANDSLALAEPVLKAAYQLGAVVQDRLRVTPYPRVTPSPRLPRGGRQLVARNALVDHVDEEVGEALAASVAHPGTLLGEVRALGGAVADVPPEATAWAGRHQAAMAAIWARPAGRRVVDEAFAPLQALASGMYGAYSSDTRAATADLTWPGETARRLRQVVARVDPQRLFDHGLVLDALDG